MAHQYEENYRFLLMRYASGSLDQAQSMAVTAHLGLSNKGHALLRQFTALGGNMLEENCSPAEMNADCLDKILDRIEHPRNEENCEPKKEINLPEKHHLTACIQNNLNCTDKTKLKWKKFYPGITFIDLPLECKQSKAKLIKVMPGKQAPAHEHNSLEITLLLDGGMHEDDNHYTVGDLVVHEAGTKHSPQACPKRGCVCLTVSEQPMKLTGIAKLLNPIVRMKF